MYALKARFASLYKCQNVLTPLVVVISCITIFLPLPTQATALSAPIRPPIETPRPAVTTIPRPILEQEPTPGNGNSNPVQIGQIILTLDGSLLSHSYLQTIVQWQGTDGTWHNVEGWRGEFNHQGHVIWWVDRNATGKGPFRWIVYEQNELKPVWTSLSFNLPEIGACLQLVTNGSISSCVVY